jgi:hypothetical protein
MSKQTPAMRDLQAFFERTVPMSPGWNVPPRQSNAGPYALILFGIACLIVAVIL